MQYEVYAAVYKKTIIYIGSGKKGVRHKHVTSGTSHVYMLNQLHFREPQNVMVIELATNLTQSRSLELELELIQHYEPCYNSVGTKHRNNKYVPVQYFENKVAPK